MKRENNLDLLRIVACIMVISIHVSAKYVVEYSKIGGIEFLIGNVWDSFSRASVPIFVMLAGKYALSNEENLNWKKYYKKILKKIYFPTLVWSLFYIFYMYLKIYINTRELKGEYGPIKLLILGKPYYHIWYLYMMIGIYLVVPFLLKIKAKISEKRFQYMGIFFLLLGFILENIIYYFTEIKIIEKSKLFLILKYFSLFSQFKCINFLGYFILGDTLKKYKKSWKKYLLITFILGILLFYSVQVTKNYGYFYNYNSIFVILYSLFLYLTFLNLDMKIANISSIAEYTFEIYLIHAIVLEVINKFFQNSDIIIFFKIPLTISGVFFISYILSRIYKKFYRS